MKTGVVLPTFRESLDEVFSVAQQAEALGVDGVFCYDHLWPMGNPARPAFAPFPVLAQISQRHPSLHLGTLVARIGLVDDAVLLEQFRTLESLSPGRVIAAMGTGDKLSRQENEAYGIAFDDPEVRRDHLRNCAEVLRDEGFEVWIGGGASPTVALAEDAGVALNMWGATPEQIADQATRSTVTWAGVLPGAEASSSAQGRAHDAALLAAVADAGATWAVAGWPASLEVLAEVSRDTQGEL